MCLAQGHNAVTPVRLEPFGLESSTLPLSHCPPPIRLDRWLGWSESSLNAHAFCWLWHVMALVILNAEVTLQNVQNMIRMLQYNQSRENPNQIASIWIEESICQERVKYVTQKNCFGTSGKENSQLFCGE